MRKNFLFILLFLLSVFLCLMAIEKLVYPFFEGNPFRNEIIILLLLLFGSILIIIRNATAKEDEHLELLRELDYFRLNIWTPLFWGAGLGAITIAFTVLMYKKDLTSFIEDNAFEVTSIFIGTVSTFIIFKGIFQKIAPITSVEKFLKILSEDLEERKFSKGSKAWIVYPALNVGYFREQVDAVQTRKYSNYVQAIGGYIDNKLAILNIVTYPVDKYEPLYKEYAKMNNKDETDPIVKDCVSEAEARIKEVIAANHKNCKAFSEEPESFPMHCIIIDDIVYLMHTFGLPDYSNNVFTSTVSVNKDKLAKVFIYRQQDRALAELLSEKLTNFTKNKTPLT